MTNSKLNFSQRNGLQAIPRPLGIGELSRKSRNAIWTILHWSMEEERPDYRLGERWRNITEYLHIAFFDLPADEYNDRASHQNETLKNLIFNGKYNEVFDMLEDVIQHIDCPADLAKDLATVFDNEMVAYRLLPEEGLITLRTSPLEEQSLEDALRNTVSGKFDGVHVHLRNAASHLRDNKPADSIRESVHAVESVMKILVNDESADFSAALNKLATRFEMHGALKSGLNSIYGYASDEKGIRHSLVEATAKPTKDEAIFILSFCASAVNYMINKNQSISTEDAS